MKDVCVCVSVRSDAKHGVRANKLTGKRHRPRKRTSGTISTKWRTTGLGPLYLMISSSNIRAHRKCMVRASGSLPSTGSVVQDVRSVQEMCTRGPPLASWRGCSSALRHANFLAKSPNISGNECHTESTHRLAGGNPSGRTTHRRHGNAFVKHPSGNVHTSH